MAARETRTVLGLDPGTRQFGWGVIRTRKGGSDYVASGVLKLKAKLTMPQKLVEIRNLVLSLAFKYDPEVLSVELPHGRYFNVVARLAEARGVALCVAQDCGMRIYQWPPAEMRTRIGLKGNAKKEQIAGLARLSLGLDDREMELDETDALGLALAAPWMEEG